MLYYNIFELGSNVLEEYVSSEASLLKNKYDWQVYALPKTVVSDSIYKKKNYRTHYQNTVESMSNVQGICLL